MAGRVKRFWFLAAWAAVFVVGAAGSYPRAAAYGQVASSVQAPRKDPPVIAVPGPLPGGLTLREQAAVFNDWLRIRLERILPDLMRQEGIDMWLVICREGNEDPVFFSLVPFTSLYASRTSMLVFFDRGAEGIERLSVSRYGIGGFYRSVWEPDKVEQWTRLAQVIKERNPKTIGIDVMDEDSYGDGLSWSLRQKLAASLGPEYAARLKSAGRLAVRWLERRSAEELEVYPHIVAIAHAIIAEAFSNRVITPGVTTAEDVAWWMRERSRQVGYTNWFQASVTVQRPKDSPFKDSTVIHRGDMLHCDFGITYLRLNTDTQELAYVLKDGEADAPKGLMDGLAQGNRLQDILMGEMKTGRTGNQILAAALARAKEAGLKPSIYTHPLGIHGHAAGPNFGMWDQQQGVPGIGDYPLLEDTVYSIELNVRANVPEWGGQEVEFALEQDASYTRAGAAFLDGRQTSMRLIK